VADPEGGAVSPPAGVAPGAIVESDRIGQGVSIGEFAIVRDGAELGDDVVIHPHTIVETGVVLGDGVEVHAGAVLGKAPSAVGQIRKRGETLRRIEVAAGCSIGVHAVVYGDVSIGAETLVGDTAAIREGSRVGRECIVGRHVTLSFNVKLGDRSRVLSATNLTGNTIVGKDAFISSHVDTANDNSFGEVGYSDEAIRGPTIGDRVRIGLGARMLPGVRIGDDALVAAGALVTRDVEPGTRVMGVPARPVPE
jgi:acetyltransferase-like isoleucine patch superfamily enzyme